MSEVPIVDKMLANVARQLAQALMDYAYSRREEDKKRLNDLQFQLCSMVRAEEERIGE